MLVWIRLTMSEFHLLGLALNLVPVSAYTIASVKEDGI